MLCCAWNVCKQHPKHLRRNDKNKGSVLKTLVNATKTAEVGYLFNASIFQRRHPDIAVPFGTTANDVARTAQGHFLERKELFQAIRCQS